MVINLYERSPSEKCNEKPGYLPIRFHISCLAAIYHQEISNGFENPVSFFSVLDIIYYMRGE
jgi:hypothetical protein